MRNDIPKTVLDISEFPRGVMPIIDISKALPIPGWMNEYELSWLAEQAWHTERIIEVGSWCGRSTMALVRHTKGLVWCVDAWRSLDCTAWAQNSEDAKREAYKAESHFLQNMDQDIECGKVQVMKMDSIGAALQLYADYGKAFDMVFLDGDHSYETVEAEIRAYRLLLKQGGILCGHDIGMEGVRQAVQELVPDAQYPAGQIWFKIV